MEGFESRIPPQNPEAEKKFLAAIMSDEQALLEGIDKVDPEDFSVKANRLIFETIKDLFSQGVKGQIDTVLVSDRLRANGVLEEAGGDAYLLGIISEMFIAANAPQYAQIIREKSTLRKLLTTAKGISNSVYQAGDGGAKAALEEAEKAILHISDRRSGSGFTRVAESIEPVWKQIQETANTKKFTGIRTGFSSLDSIFYGIKPGNFVIVAGRPGAGKTAMMLNLAENISIRQDIPVAFFNLEMSKEELTMRILSQFSQIPNAKFKSGDMQPDDWSVLAKAAARCADAKFYIDDSMDNSITSIRSACRKAKARYDIGMVFIDYLQLMTSDSKKESRAVEVSDMSRSLKMLARELNVPIVVGAQLNRSGEKENRKPQVSDLRESGSIEQDADIVILLHRECLKDPKPENLNSANVIVAKNRNGRLEDLPFYYDGDTMNFKSVAKMPESGK